MTVTLKQNPHTSSFFKKCVSSVPGFRRNNNKKKKSRASQRTGGVLQQGSDGLASHNHIQRLEVYFLTSSTEHLILV